VRRQMVLSCRGRVRLCERERTWTLLAVALFYPREIIQRALDDSLY
jgi:hypothetical protein